MGGGRWQAVLSRGSWCSPRPRARTPAATAVAVSPVSPGACASLNSRYPLPAQVPVSPKLLLTLTLTLCFSTAAPGSQMNETGLGRPGARAAGVK